MKPLTAEWVAKAEGDFTTALRESRARTEPNFDAVCFHAQQCAEKYLKAWLQERSIPFGKTHDLAALLDQIVPLEPSWARMRARLDALTDNAVEIRYPGTTADRTMARDALRTCREMRSHVRSSLGLNS